MESHGTAMEWRVYDVHSGNDHTKNFTQGSYSALKLQRTLEFVNSAIIRCKAQRK